MRKCCRNGLYWSPRMTSHMAGSDRSRFVANRSAQKPSVHFTSPSATGRTFACRLAASAANTSPPWHDSTTAIAAIRNILWHFDTCMLSGCLADSAKGRCLFVDPGDPQRHPRATREFDRAVVLVDKDVVTLSADGDRLGDRRRGHVPCVERVTT